MRLAAWLCPDHESAYSAPPAGPLAGFGGWGKWKLGRRRDRGKGRVVKGKGS